MLSSNQQQTSTLRLFGHMCLTLYIQHKTTTTTRKLKLRKIISATLQTTIATKGTHYFFALIKSVLFVWGEVQMETSSKQ